MLVTAHSRRGRAAAYLFLLHSYFLLSRSALGVRGRVGPGRSQACSGLPSRPAGPKSPRPRRGIEARGKSEEERSKRCRAAPGGPAHGEDKKRRSRLGIKKIPGREQTILLRGATQGSKRREPFPLVLHGCGKRTAGVSALRSSAVFPRFVRRGFQPGAPFSVPAEYAVLLRCLSGSLALL